MRITIFIVLAATAAAVAYLYWPVEEPLAAVAPQASAAGDPAKPKSSLADGARRVAAPAGAPVISSENDAGFTAPTMRPAEPVEEPPLSSDAREFAATWDQVTRDAKAKRVSDFRQLGVYGQMLESVPHEEFEQKVAPLLVKVRENDAATEALWLDLAQRPQAMSLPLLANLAAKPGHPMSELARETLQGFLGESYSTDPGKLRLAISRLTEGGVP